MFCPRCGANNEANQRFCYNCGTRLEAVAQPENPPAVSDIPSPPVYTPPQNVPPAMPQYGSMTSYPPVAQTNGLAIASLVCSILAWTGLLIVVGAIAGVVMGHLARREIARSNGMQSGSGLATAGLILGYVHLAFAALGICFFLLVIIGYSTGGV
jgi:uncharacterized membrane protein